MFKREYWRVFWKRLGHPRCAITAVKWKTGQMPIGYTVQYKKHKPREDRGNVPIIFYALYLNQFYLHMLEKLIISQYVEFVMKLLKITSVTISIVFLDYIHRD